MTESNNVEKLIDKKIQDAKLERYEEQLVISKNQMNFFFKIGGGLLAVFGLFIPILISFINTEKVDDAIDSMEKRVERLINLKLRSPDIIGVFNNQEVKDDLVIKYDFKIVKNKREISGTEKQFLKILNRGDAPAEKLRILLYLKSDTLVNSKYKHKIHGWKKWQYSDEEGFNSAYIYTEGGNEAIVLIIDASEYIPIEFDYSFFNWNNRKINEIDAILKVHFGQPSPYRIPLKIQFNDTLD